MYCPLSHLCKRSSSTAWALLTIAVVIGTITLFTLLSTPLTEQGPPTIAPEGWQPVSCPDGGCQFRLPPQWSLAARATDGGFARYEREQNVFEVSVAKADATSLDDELASLDLQRSTAYEGTSAVRVLSEEPDAIGGRDAVVREVFLNAAGLPAMETFVLVNGKLYVFSSLFGAETSPTDEDRSGHGDILRTVTFTP